MASFLKAKLDGSISTGGNGKVNSYKESRKDKGTGKIQSHITFLWGWGWEERKDAVFRLNEIAVSDP